MIRIHKCSSQDLRSEINIVPLLDVLLVILLVFMSTIPIVTENLEVDLPNSPNSKIISNNGNAPVIIEVSDIGKYSLIVNQNYMKQLSSEQILSEIHYYLKSDPKTVVLIGGAKNIPYDEIIKVLSLLHKAGAKSVGLMTQPI